jgi:hypothetical protein
MELTPDWPFVWRWVRAHEDCAIELDVPLNENSWQQKSFPVRYDNDNQAHITK